MNQRRTSVHIVADILRLGLAGKTEIMYSVNLTHKQLVNYLKFLDERDLIHCEEPRANGIPQYHATEKGDTLLKEIDTVLSTLKFEHGI